jgi:WhiB family redox-sensing transcriptional regulator
VGGVTPILASFPELDGTQACADEDPDLFFPYPTDGAGIAAAKAVCGLCPLQRPCLAWALQHGDDGVWGGLTAEERRSLQRRFRIPRISYPPPPTGRPTPNDPSTGFDDSED